MYVIIELRKFTAPIPSGIRTRAAYGKVITGKRIPVIVFIAFKIILPFIEGIINVNRLVARE